MVLHQMLNIMDTSGCEICPLFGSDSYSELNTYKYRMRSGIKKAVC